MLPPTSALLAQRYTVRAQRLLRSVECFVRSRDTIEKYTETVAACTRVAVLRGARAHRALLRLRAEALAPRPLREGRLA